MFRINYRNGLDRLRILLKPRDVPDESGTIRILNTPTPTRINNLAHLGLYPVLSDNDDPSRPCIYI